MTRSTALVFFSICLWTTASARPTFPSLECSIPILKEAEYNGGLSSQYPGGKLKLTCKDNYYDTATFVTCLPNKTWSQPTPPCTLVKCPESFDLEHGSHNMSTQLYGGTLSMWCTEGYRYTGTAQRLCQRDGSWSGTDGACTEIECPSFNAPEHGRWNSSDRTYQSVISVICTEGYIYTGSQMMQCLADKSWSGHSGICTKVQCPELTVPKNGRIDVQTRGYNDSATVECNEGYNYSRPEHRIRHCKGDNTWSGVQGVCERIWCHKIYPVRNGVLSPHVVQHMDHIELQCHSGYSVDGISKVTCQADTSYNAQLGSCKWNGKYLLYLLVLPLALAIALVIWRYQERKKRNSPPKTELRGLLQHKEVYFSFKMTGNIDNEEHNNFRKCLKKAIKQAFSKTDALQWDRTPSTVTVKYLSLEKGFAMVSMNCQEVNESVYTALCDATISTIAGMKYKIKRESLIFIDPVGAAVASEIYKQQHVTEQPVDKKIDLDAQYVGLRLLDMKNMGGIHKDDIEMNTDKDRPDYYQLYLETCGGKDIQEEDLVTKDEIGKCTLMRGRAGIGKSTTIQKFFWKWAHGEWGKQFKAIFLLNIRHFLNINTKMDLWQLLSMHSVYAPDNVDETWLEENEQHLCIVLDGIDELWNFKGKWATTDSRQDIQGPQTGLDWCFSLLQRKCLSSATVIVSSRPFTDLILIQPSKLVEVMGLTRELVMAFVEKNVAANRIGYVMKTLRDNPILLSVSAITYYCAALCRVLEGTDLGTEDLKTYTQINAYIIEDYMRRCLKVAGFKVNIDTGLRAISRLAYSGLVKTGPADLTRLIFSQSEYKELHITDDELDLMSRAGIFSQTKVVGKERPGEEQTLGQFAHLSIQEFLAMAGYLLQDGSAAGACISEMFAAGQFLMAQLYLFGLVFNSGHTSVATVTGRLGLSDGRMKGLQEGLRNELLTMEASENIHGMQCIHEAQCMQAAELYAAQKLKSEVEFLNTPLTAIDINALEFTLRHHVGSLKTLKLAEVNFDVTSIRTVMGIVNESPNMKSLQLGHGPIGDKGISSINNVLGKATGLSKLCLGWYNVTDTDLRKVVDAFIHNHLLKEFGITSNLLTDEGVKYTATALQGNTTLNNIGLIISSMQEEAVDAIVAALDINKRVFIFIDLEQPCAPEVQEKLKTCRGLMLGKC